MSSFEIADVALPIIMPTLKEIAYQAPVGSFISSGFYSLIARADLPFGEIMLIYGEKK